MSRYQANPRWTARGRDRRFVFSDPYADREQYGHLGPSMNGVGRFGRFGATNVPQYTIAADASIDPRFSAGDPGTYVIRARVKDLPLSAPSKRLLTDPKPFNDAIGGRSNARVVAVKFVGQGPVRDKNWAQSAIKALFGGNTSDNAIADMLFDVTVVIPQREGVDPKSLQGPKDEYIPDDYVWDGRAWVPPPPVAVTAGIGMGAVQIGAGAAIVILAAVALVLAATFDGFGKVVIDAVKFAGKAVSAAVGAAAGAIAENAIPILIVVGIAAGAIWLLKKGGAKYTSKGGRFSF